MVQIEKKTANIWEYKVVINANISNVERFEKVDCMDHALKLPEKIVVSCIFCEVMVQGLSIMIIMDNRRFCSFGITGSVPSTASYLPPIVQEWVFGTNL